MNRKAVIRKKILDLTEDKDWMKKTEIIRQVNALGELLILDGSSRKKENKKLGERYVDSGRHGTFND